MDPIVSVVIPTYNSENFIIDTLKSVEGVEYSNWECIIVDDFSDDNTYSIVEEFISKKYRFTLYKNKLKGVASARNYAINNSKGKYILPLDGDDLISPTYISKAVSILENNHSIGLVYCQAELFGEKQGKWTLEPFDKKLIFLDNMIFVSTVFRKSDFERTLGFNENMTDGLEDWDFILSMVELGLEVYRIPEVHFYYRIRKNSRQQRIDKQKRFKLYLQIIYNHQDSYNKYFGSPQDAYTEVIRLEKLIKTIRESKSYRIGNAIVGIIKKILFK